jgi:hypothetical protein
MAILHRATLTPSKIELLTAHVMAFPSLRNTSVSDFSLLGSYRFDDPADKVGMEAHLVSAGSGPVIHIPLTYREAPMVGAEDWLIDTMEHSVLGTRWIYNACGDAVYVQELVRAILTGDSQVEQFVETADGPVLRPSTASVVGSGVAEAPVPHVDSVQGAFDGNDTVIAAGGLEIVVRHILTESVSTTGPMLTGTWPGSETPVALAYIRQ